MTSYSPNDRNDDKNDVYDRNDDKNDVSCIVSKFKVSPIVRPILYNDYMTSFDNVIFINNFDRKFDKRVVDDISPTSILVHAHKLEII